MLSTLTYFLSCAEPIIHTEGQTNDSPTRVTMAARVGEDQFGRGGSLQPPTFPVVQLYHCTRFGDPISSSGMRSLRLVVVVVQPIAPGEFAIC